MELAWRERRLDGMIQELAVVNSYVRDLNSQVDGVMKGERHSVPTRVNPAREFKVP
jgi:hypothetical protein